MPELTDEERVQAIEDGVERPNKSDDPDSNAEPDLNPDDPEHEDKLETGELPTNPDSSEDGKDPEDEPSPTDSPDKEEPTFTKQFPNLKGDTPAEYVPALEEAYSNSTNEALRLKKESDDKDGLISSKDQEIQNLRAQLAGQPAPATPAPPVDPASTVQQPAVNLAQPIVPALPAPTDPNLAWAKAAREKEMLDSFGKFKEKYPQAVDKDNFQTFLNASKGVEDAWKATHGGILPTYDDLYQGIANVLRWEPIEKTAKKNDAIKTQTTQSRPNTATPPATKKPKVSDGQVDLHLRMFPGKTRDQAIKELSEVAV